MKIKKFVEAVFTAEGGDEQTFETKVMQASITVQKDTDDDDVHVTIPGQFMQDADLRQAAKLFARLAERLEGGA